MKRSVATAVMVVVVAIACVGLRVVWVHGRYGEWQVSPASPPLRISTLGRDYDRSTSLPDIERLPGLSPVVSTELGTVLSPSGTTEPPPVVIYLEDDEGHVWSYALVGGP